MLTITPFLWFDTQAEEAMQFYTSIFPRSTVHAVHRAGAACWRWSSRSRASG